MGINPSKDREPTEEDYSDNEDTPTDRDAMKNRKREHK